MTCYHPLYRIELLTKKKKVAEDGHKYFATQIIPSSKIENYLKKTSFQSISKIQEIPCRNCIGCRLDYSREWANRGYLESKCHLQNWFVTLTYDENNMVKKDHFEDKNGITWYDEEWNGTLQGKDFTAFMKELRQIMKREYNEDGIRFMGCGEYGEENQRPHYHLILFGLNLPADTFFEPRIINKETYYRNKIIERAWNKGISNISEASWNNIAYTARYITKKINGKLSDEYYNSKGQDKEFMRSSRMGGIGKPYYDLHKDKIYENDEIIITNKTGTISCRPPKYFDYLYEKENPKRMKEIKIKRIKEGKISDRLKDQQASYDKLDRLAIQERTKDERTQLLIRQFEKKV